MAVLQGLPLLVTLLFIQKRKSVDPKPTSAIVRLCRTLNNDNGDGREEDLQQPYLLRQKLG